VENRKTVNKSRLNNKLQTVTDTQQDTLCIVCGQSLTDDSFDDSAVNSGPTRTVMKL